MDRKTGQADKADVVAEIEGEYGPVSISERMVQKLWTRGEFLRTGLRTLEGSALEIKDLGTWNLLPGPDFKGVTIEVDGQRIRGDAEMHFFAADWRNHGHEGDPAYADVVLHILVFPPKEPLPKQDCSVPHSLLFLDLLPQGLECYAEEEAVGALSADQESALEESLLVLSPGKRMKYVAQGACKRWHGKVNYARKRMEHLGWEEACHQTALEILGYRRNRAAMLYVAGDYTLSALRSGDYDTDDLFSAGRERWRLSGTRPANHPRHRLGQYLDWLKRRPRWPDVLSDAAAFFPEQSCSTIFDVSRKTLSLSLARRKLSESVVANSIAGTRIETLVCDGFLPLIEARAARALFPYWFYWYSGDIPTRLKRLARVVATGMEKPVPLCNGLLQGLLYSLLESAAPR